MDDNYFYILFLDRSEDKNIYIYTFVYIGFSGAESGNMTAEIRFISRAIPSYIVILKASIYFMILCVSKINEDDVLWK